MIRPATRLIEMLDLDTWRTREGLSWEQVAALMAGDDPERPVCRVSTCSIRRFGIGERWPDPDIIERLEEITGGEVTVLGLHRRRAEWLKASGRPRRVPVCLHE